MNRDTQEILVKFKKDLSEITSPSERIIEMGCFIEVINLSLKECLLFKHKKLIEEKKVGLSLYQYWEKRLTSDRFPELNTTSLLDGINDLNRVYRARNKCAHKDPLAADAIKKVDTYESMTLDGVKQVCRHLLSWRESPEADHFETCLMRNADRRPGYVLIDRLAARMLLCKESANNRKRHGLVKRCLERYCEERGLRLVSYAGPPSTSAEQSQMWRDIIESQSSALRSLCGRLSSDRHESSFSGYISELIKYYIENALDPKDIDKVIMPFIDQELGEESESDLKTSRLFNTLYIKLDPDDHTSPGWPQRLNDVQLIPNLRKAEGVIDSTNDGRAELFRDASELAIFIKKRLVTPLKERDIDVKELALVVEFKDFCLAHEELHLTNIRGKSKIEEFFKSVLIRLSDDPEEALSLSGRYISSFIASEESSGLVTSPVEGELSDELNGRPEVVLLAEDAVREDALGCLYEEIYYTDIPFIVMSLDPNIGAQELTEEIFNGEPKITLDQLLAEVKRLRTELKKSTRKPIQLFIDDAELNPHLATPL